MASNGSAAAEEPPTATQLLFARAVILTMELWPVMRLAVSEQWGGPESKDKRDYLVSWICDEFSSEPSQLVQQQALAQQEQRNSQSNGAPSGSTLPTIRVQPPKTPDVDDLADTFGMYFDDEFESRIEDGSEDWVARRIVNFHKSIYSVFPPTGDSLDEASAEVERLAQAALQLRGTKLSAQQNPEYVSVIREGDPDAGSGSDDDSDDGRLAGAAQGMSIDGEGASGGANGRSAARQEPIVDEDGFTTVVKGRRR